MNSWLRTPTSKTVTISDTVTESNESTHRKLRIYKEL
jgi:hypothetical protein